MKALLAGVHLDPKTTFFSLPIFINVRPIDNYMKNYCKNINNENVINTQSLSGSKWTPGYLVVWLR